MQNDQLLLFAILAATIGLFLWGRWRHDVVALAALLVCVFAGLVPSDLAFTGFGHPAVITVAAVLVLSRGLQNTGAVDALAQRVLTPGAGPTLSIAVLIGVGAVLSAFMNNVGAMALLIPVAVQTAGRHDLPPGKVLMPLAFGTLLGGMTTLIGTPPNLIVASFRESTGAGSFGMFDFTPVGLAVALGGLVFLALLGWRIVPHREQKGGAHFDTGTYLTEAWVSADGKAVGKHLNEVERTLEAADAQVVGMVRNDFRVTAPNPWRVLRAGDILVIEADPGSLTTTLSGLGLSLESPDKKDGPKPERRKGDEDKKSSDKEETVLQELVVLPNAAIIGRSVGDVHIGTRFGLNLLAISRQGRQSIKRLRSTPIRAGDVLLMQGVPEALSAFASSFGGVPLAPRDISIPNRNQATLAVIIMMLAIAGAAFGLLPAAIAFATAVLAYIVLRIIPLDKVFDAVDWPVIILLGALIPVAGAMASTGAADALAKGLLGSLAQGHPVVALALVLIVTMTLSDFMNNAATAAVMCPIAISIASQLGAAPDAFLMAVAIGGSCAFLTPIGHQNNTLILGPGGFSFGDYWRLGLPMEVLVVTISLPMLLWVWPL
ncbi:MAG: SLC13 family permease [Zoogloeaceae bacterium]|uniref:SLC13 family permease n=1 Tax=Denitromonas sp. TaxID=2734609 RepID=UPI001DB61C85|nr:SLC13 family permease [Rhodocyclaceae bacterium]MCP5223448.1 SLC13 family permease [Zoogloeaceae bacterium]HPR05337.1 SLC13 family permease [Denitromonas sp.]